MKQDLTDEKLRRLQLVDESNWQIDTVRDVRNTMDIRYGVHRQISDVSAYLVFLNGRTEWIEKYDYLPQDLELPPSVGFLTMDHRGQGASGGARAFVDSYDSFATDVLKVLQKVVGDKPYCLVGHSMGGLIALYGTLKGLLTPKSLVMCSPLLGMPDEPVKRKIAKPVARMLSKLFFGPIGTGAGLHTRGPFERNRLTHDFDMYKRMQDSPYKPSPATFGWVNATFEAVDFVCAPSSLAKLKIPSLVLVGSEETVVDAQSFAAWVKKASEHSKAEIMLRVIPGARHELLSEVDAYYDQTIREIRRWALPSMREQ